MCDYEVTVEANSDALVFEYRNWEKFAEGLFVIFTDGLLVPVCEVKPRLLIGSRGSSNGNRPASRGYIARYLRPLPSMFAISHVQ
jgi:hypothetical protein